jgi:hypothetical protein
MPKLNDLQLAERLRKRIAELEAGVEIAAKDVRALLTESQHQQLESAWKEQQQLRKQKRATNEEQQKALGWKSKRELRIDAFKQALDELKGNELKVLRSLQQKKNVNQSRVYLDTYFEEISKGVSKNQAEGRANNALTRAHLRKSDDIAMGDVGKRNKEIEEIERSLIKLFKKTKDINNK